MNWLLRLSAWIVLSPILFIGLLWLSDRVDHWKHKEEIRLRLACKQLGFSERQTIELLDHVRRERKSGRK